MIRNHPSSRRSGQQSAQMYHHRHSRSQGVVVATDPLVVTKPQWYNRHDRSSTTLTCSMNSSHSSSAMSLLGGAMMIMGEGEGREEGNDPNGNGNGGNDDGNDNHPVEEDDEECCTTSTAPTFLANHEESMPALPPPPSLEDAPPLLLPPPLHSSCSTNSSSRQRRPPRSCLRNSRSSTRNLKAAAAITSINNNNNPEDQSQEEQSQQSLSSSQPKKLLSWSDISIYTHVMILGDNPSVSGGVPVTIDWEAVHSVTLRVDDFEAQREHQRRVSPLQLLLPRSLRESLCREAGAPRSQLTQVQQSMQHIKQQRQRSARHGAWRLWCRQRGRAPIRLSLSSSSRLPFWGNHPKSSLRSNQTTKSQSPTPLSNPPIQRPEQRPAALGDTLLPSSSTTTAPTRTTCFPQRRRPKQGVPTGNTTMAVDGPAAVAATTTSC
ncbi:hypothetical protein ACA910_014959 [Epithemia clementina (nom. ined.)]